MIVTNFDLSETSHSGLGSLNKTLNELSGLMNSGYTRRDLENLESNYEGSISDLENFSIDECSSTPNFNGKRILIRRIKEVRQLIHDRMLVLEKSGLDNYINMSNILIEIMAMATELETATPRPLSAYDQISILCNQSLDTDVDYNERYLTRLVDCDLIQYATVILRDEYTLMPDATSVESGLVVESLNIMIDKLIAGNKNVSKNPGAILKTVIGKTNILMDDVVELLQSPKKLIDFATDMAKQILDSTIVVRNIVGGDYISDQLMNTWVSEITNIYKLDDYANDIETLLILHASIKLRYRPNTAVTG